MVALADIIARVEGYHPNADIGLIERAFAYSEKSHQGQWRRSGAPYFSHPCAVALIITDMRLDAASIAAALLHDVIEDTPCTREDIAELFGEDVAILVDGVTKLGRVNFQSKEEQQAESFRKMLIAMARDIRVLLVKLADRLDNMRTLEFMRPESRRRIAQETQDIYAPLAARMGMHWLKAELEDLSGKHRFPEAFRELEEQVRREGKDSERYIRQVSEQVQGLLRSSNIEAEVHGRLKHLASIHDKMKRTGCSFEQVQDFIAFRVLVEDISCCYAALGALHSTWTPIPGRFKDFIALPKPNMYQSLHTTVIGPGQRRIEIQIRTQAMHRTAEYGIAAHWEYKQGAVSQKDNVRFAWLRQLAESQHEVSDPSEFLEVVRGDLFQDEVYVFTPKGDVKTFPRGATPIDFAYSIHSEVGDHCQGARVNGVIMPLRGQLHSGDVVEVITSASQKPSKDWLNHAVTGRASSRIRAFLRNEERVNSIKLGRDILERELRRYGFSLQKFMKNESAQRITQHYQLQALDDLFAHVGYGHISTASVVGQLDVQAPEQKSNMRQGIIERAFERVTRRRDGIVIEGHDDIMVRFARCCSPVPGDSVTGWITRGRGVTVHRKSCPSAMELDPDRRIEVSWATDAKVRLPAVVQVATEDRRGVLADLSSAFHQHIFNIREASCRVDQDGMALNDFHIDVEDLDQLERLMRALGSIPGVIDVRRLASQERIALDATEKRLTH